jgi:hypothetical protein
MSPEERQEAIDAFAAWANAKNSTEWRHAAFRLAALGGWEWWLAVARGGESARDYKLVGQIDGFATQSNRVLLGEPGFIPAPRAARQSMDEIAVRCLRYAPSDLVIQDGVGGGRIDVAQLLEWATGRIEKGLYD